MPERLRPGRNRRTRHQRPQSIPKNEIPPPLRARPSPTPRPSRPALVTAARLPSAPQDLLAARLRSPARPKLEERIRDVPCWLASLVLHMLLIIVLGTLVAPTHTRDAVRILICYLTRDVPSRGQEQGSSLVTMTTLHAPSEDGPRRPDIGQDQQLAAFLEKPAPSPTPTPQPAPAASGMDGQGWTRIDLPM